MTTGRINQIAISRDSCRAFRRSQNLGALETDSPMRPSTNVLPVRERRPRKGFAPFQKTCRKTNGVFFAFFVMKVSSLLRLTGEGLSGDSDRELDLTLEE